MTYLSILDRRGMRLQMHLWGLTVCLLTTCVPQAAPVPKSTTHGHDWAVKRAWVDHEDVVLGSKPRSKDHGALRALRKHAQPRTAAHRAAPHRTHAHTHTRTQCNATQRNACDAFNATRAMYRAAPPRNACAMPHTATQRSAASRRHATHATPRNNVNQCTACTTHAGMGRGAWHRQSANVGADAHGQPVLRGSRLGAARASQPARRRPSQA